MVGDGLGGFCGFCGLAGLDGWIAFRSSSTVIWLLCMTS